MSCDQAASSSFDQYEGARSHQRQKEIPSALKLIITHPEELRTTVAPTVDKPPGGIADAEGDMGGIIGCQEHCVGIGMQVGIAVDGGISQINARCMSAQPEDGDKRHCILAGEAFHEVLRRAVGKGGSYWQIPGFCQVLNNLFLVAGGDCPTRKDAHRLKTPPEVVNFIR